jgi:VanZ family protein
MITFIKKNILSIITASLIFYLSLENAETLDKVSIFSFPHIDKIVHFGMYFSLMLCLLYEHRTTNKEFRGQLLMAIIPLVYGITLEFFQSNFTATRSGDIIDGLFNFFGIVAALSGWRIYFILIKKED